MFRRRFPILIHQSDLSALARCPAEFGYKRAGLPDTTNSATSYGSVMHHALHVFERERAHGTPWATSLQMALETFVHFWNPLNIEEISEPVPADGWLPRHSYAELRSRGIDTVRKYADLVRYDDHELLAIEYGFSVPIDGTWDIELEQPHVLSGTVDRLSARHFSRILALCIDDWKTGRDYTYLRHNLQFTAYAYASTKREFWVGWNGEDGFGEQRGDELYQRFLNKGRRGTWINLRTVKFEDAGWRGPNDYARLALAVDQYVAMVQAEIFPMNIKGEICRYCDYRNVCGGFGISAPDHGKPEGLR